MKRLRKENEEKESDFDTEKLRAYEASKLKYYFAVVEFTLPEYADVAYKEVDGLELEHSSAAMDLRAIPPDEVDGVVKDRQLRDEATSIPSNYQPPDFVISALQQSSVQCTWEDGDEERQRKLTGYGTGQPGSWGATVEEDDLRAYLASDVSTSDEEESGDDSDNGGGGKGSKIRKMLGLESSDDDNENNGDNTRTTHHQKMKRTMMTFQSKLLSFLERPSWRTGFVQSSRRRTKKNLLLGKSTNKSEKRSGVNGDKLGESCERVLIKLLMVLVRMPESVEAGFGSDR